MNFLNTPNVFFWYGVLEAMHADTPQGHECMEFAKETIFYLATSAGREQCKAAEWLCDSKNFLNTDEYYQRAWHFATWFVLSGRASMVSDYSPNAVGLLEVTPEGIQQKRASYANRRKARKPANNTERGSNYAPF